MNKFLTQHSLLASLNPFKTCPLCQQTTRSAQTLCDYCLAQLPWLLKSCGCCSVALSISTPRCGQCLLDPPLRTRTVCAFHYAFPVRQMITGFKFEDRFYYLPPLIEALQQAVLDHYAQDALPTALLAVPLHRHRQQHRGFNQAQMIAQSMKKKLAIPVLPHCVQRRINTPAQSQLSAAERHQNLRQAFFVKQPERIQQQHIVIIDDVLTTGSTVEALAKLLLQNGATRVDAWCLAKA